MIEVFYEILVVPFSEEQVLYIKNDLFVWSNVIKANGWAKRGDFPALLDLRLVKLFELIE